MYSKAKIYKIVDSGYNECYYGSTVQPLSKRMGQHREKYHLYKDGKFALMTSFNLFDKYGLENCKIELVENYECKSKEELHQREAYWIRNNNCVNKFIPTRTKKEHYEDNKEEISKNKKEYYEDNKEEILQKCKEYYQDKKDDIVQRVKIYRDSNKEYIYEDIVCECGGKYKRKHKSTHEKTKKHIGYLSQK